MREGRGVSWGKGTNSYRPSRSSSGLCLWLLYGVELVYLCARNKRSDALTSWILAQAWFIEGAFGYDARRPCGAVCLRSGRFSARSRTGGIDGRCGSRDPRSHGSRGPGRRRNLPDSSHQSRSGSSGKRKSQRRSCASEFSKRTFPSCVPQQLAGPAGLAVHFASSASSILGLLSPTDGSRCRRGIRGHCRCQWKHSRSRELRLCRLCRIGKPRP